MPEYVRTGRAIHIKGPDGSTRCFPGRYDTSQWETVIPGERDWQNVCINCMKTPSSPEKFYPLVKEDNKLRKALNQTLKHK